VITGLSHFGFTVRDVDISAAWYENVLGFHRQGGYTSSDGSFRKVFLRHPAVPARLTLAQHLRGHHEPFDEKRVGLDHMAFAVAGRAALDDWAERLAAAEVPHSPVAPANSIPGAAVLVFRDPDNIQLELFYQPSDGATLPT